MIVTLAERNTGMNWEVASVLSAKLTEVLQSARDRFKHDCICEIEPREESDGGPYFDNTATHYYLVVKGSKDTNPKFVEGIKDVINMVSI